MNTTVKFIIIPSKVNIVVDSLNGKERVKPIHARIMSMVTHPSNYAKRVFNVKAGIVDIGYNVVITSHTPSEHRGPETMFNYDDVFTSFNGPITFGAGSSAVDDIERR